MKKRKILTFAVVVALLILLAPVSRMVGGYLLGQNRLEFKFVEIGRGDVKKTVSSSGPLSPIKKVEVGSQVSGTIAKVHVDYNDRVQKDQVLAELDMSLLKAEVGKAEGNLLRIQAQLEDARNDYNRNLPLHQKGVIPDSVLLSSQIKVKSLEGDIKHAQAALDFAKRNLEYASIRSPIAGTVVTKQVEEGQTLAVQFMIPCLFEIAEDLSRMEILVAVDESDIGLVQPGQKARFTVQAYTDKTFSGTVKKVRLQPMKVANVVNYTVEVDTENKEGLLLPGMTAEVDFIIAEKKNVLTVPKTALNFTPEKDALRRFVGRLHPSAVAQLTPSNPAVEPDEHTGFLWFLNDQGELAVQEVKIGVTDGSHTELVDAGPFREGMKVISGVVETDKDKKTEKTKRLIGMPGPGGGGGPPPGP